MAEMEQSSVQAEGCDHMDEEVRTPARRIGSKGKSLFQSPALPITPSTEEQSPLSTEATLSLSKETRSVEWQFDLQRNAIIKDEIAQQQQIAHTIEYVTLHVFPVLQKLRNEIEKSSFVLLETRVSWLEDQRRVADERLCRLERPIQRDLVNHPPPLSLPPQLPQPASSTTSGSTVIAPASSPQVDQRKQKHRGGKKVRKEKALRALLQAL